MVPYPVVPFMVASHRGEGPAAPEPAESINLLFQRPGTGVAAYHHGADDLLFALKVTHDGLTPMEAAEAAGQPLELVEAVRGALEEVMRIVGGCGDAPAFFEELEASGRCFWARPAASGR